MELSSKLSCSVFEGGVDGLAPSELVVAEASVAFWGPSWKGPMSISGVSGRKEGPTCVAGGTGPRALARTLFSVICGKGTVWHFVTCSAASALCRFRWEQVSRREVRIVVHQSRDRSLVFRDA
jgi:hypothetical protein